MGTSARHASQLVQVVVITPYSRSSPSPEYMLMNPDNEWNEILKGHPIFSLPKSYKGPTAEAETSLELSTNTLPRFVKVDPLDDGPTPSGRRQTMVLKDADLIVAAGREIRMTSLSDTKLGQSARKTYKVCGNLTTRASTVLYLPSCAHTDTAHTKCSVRNPPNCVEPQWKTSCYCRGFSGGGHCASSARLYALGP